MNLIEHLLSITAEEGNEVGKECIKSLRFGLSDRKTLDPTVINTDPGEPTNAEKIVDELNDLFAMVEMLVEHGVIPPTWPNDAKREAKKAKVLEYLKYSHLKGTLQL